MNLRFQLLLIGVFSIMLFSCNKDKNGFEKTASGLKYRVVESKGGKKAEMGDIMIMDIAYFTDYDSLLFNSRQQSDSFTVKLVPPTFTGGVEEGFAMLGIGDSAVFQTSADSIFEKTFHGALPGYLKKGAALTFRVRMKNIVEKAVYDSILRVKDIESRKLEFQLIDAFLTKNKMDVMPTENGVYVTTSETGSGEAPAKGDTVAVMFEGRLLDGSMFDKAQDRNKPFEFVFGSNMVIAGWEECMSYFRKGAIIRMVVPSDLGFGAQPYGELPAYSTLVFDVEVLSIKKGPQP